MSIGKRSRGEAPMTMTAAAKASRTLLAGALAASVSLAALPAAPAAAQTGGAAEASAGSGEVAVRAEPFPMKVNMVAYLPLTGRWTLDNTDKTVVKLGRDGSLTAKKVGHATVTCTSDSGEVRVFDVAVSKSTFKPVAMKKLQCYKGYRKYMTAAQFEKAYKKALKMVTPAGDLDRQSQLQYVTSALRRYFDENMSYESKKAHYNDPYGYLCLKRASCAGAARTTRLCLNILGIRAEHVNENKWTHQWCRVKVGKSYWIADPYGMYCGKEPAKRKHPYL